MKVAKTLFFIVIILIGGSFLSTRLFQQAVEVQVTQKRADFYRRTQEFILSMKGRIIAYETILEALGAFFSSSDEVTLKEWQDYTSSINLVSKTPSIQFLAFIQNIPKSAVDATIQKNRLLGVTDFKIWPPTDQSTYFPILYIAPSTYSDLVGFDLAQNPDISSAMIKSGSNSEMFAANGIQLEKVVSKKSILSLMLRTRGDPNPNKEIRATHFGWVLASLDLSLETKALAKEFKLTDINIVIFKGAKTTPEAPFVALLPSPDVKPKFTDEQTINIDGVELTFQFTSGPAYKRGIDYTYPIAHAFGSSLVWLFLILWVYSINKEKNLLSLTVEKVEKNVSQIIAMRKAILDSANYSIICTDAEGTILIFNKASEKMLGYSAREIVGRVTPIMICDPIEISERSKELSALFGKPILPGFGVFVALAQRGLPDERDWHYIRKDKSQVVVSLSITEVKDEKGALIGYMGIAHEK